MTAYMIARFDITDPEGAKTAYPKYVEEAAPASKAAGARYLVRGGTAHPLEGPARGRNVVIAFADMDAGRGWYGSDAYQAGRRHRVAVAAGEMVLVQGMSEAVETEMGDAATVDGKKGYWIARYDVREFEPYKDYAKDGAPAFAQYQATYLARGGAHEALEGPARARNVLIEFPSVQHAIDCYRSETYQKAREHRLPVSTGEIVIVEGV